MEKVMRKHFKERYSSEGFEMDIYPPVPPSLSIELNNTCNHACIFCDAHSPQRTTSLKPCVMDFELVKRILDNASELGIGQKELGLYMNGEPFLYARLEDVVLYAKAKKKFPYIYLTTNGAVKDFSRIQGVVDAGLDSIRFSVNGSNREEYKRIHGRDDFDLVIKNIKKLSEYRKNNDISLAISVSVVVTPDTIKNENMTREFWADIVDDVMFIRVIQSNEIIDSQGNLFFKQEDGEVCKDFKCKSIFESMFIDAGGHVLLCCTSETIYNEETYVTQITADDEIELNKIWHMPKYVHYRKLFIEGKDLTGTACEKCIIRKRHGKAFMD